MTTRLCVELSLFQLNSLEGQSHQLSSYDLYFLSQIVVDFHFCLKMKIFGGAESEVSRHWLKTCFAK
jgi:hypothetical protein